MQRRKLNRAWEILRAMPVPAIASDRLVDLHNDLTDYDLVVAREMKRFLRSGAIRMQCVRVDVELEENLRSFKTENSAEVECRRELLRYKRRIDDVVRELLRLVVGAPSLSDLQPSGEQEEAMADPLADLRIMSSAEVAVQPAG